MQGRTRSFSVLLFLALSPPTSPTAVYLHFLFNDVGELEAIGNQYYGDFYLSTAWVDPRLGNVTGDFDTTNYFTPVLEVVNSKNNDGIFSAILWNCGWGRPAWLERTETAPHVTTPGWVNCQARLAGQFGSELYLGDFPQDVQFARIVIESYTFTSDLLQLVPATGIEDVAYPSDLAVLGWSRVDPGAQVLTLDYTYDAWNQVYSRVVIAVQLRRESGYYISRVVTNIILLEIMSFFFIFLRATDPNRLLGNLAVFAAIVTWMFVLLLDTPKVSYQTRLDRFLQLSFACIFVLSVLHGFQYVHLSFLDYVQKKAEEHEEEELLEEEKKVIEDIKEGFAPSAAAIDAVGEAPHLHHVPPPQEEGSVAGGARAKSVRHTQVGPEPNAGAAAPAAAAAGGVKKQSAKRSKSRRGKLWSTLSLFEKLREHIRDGCTGDRVIDSIGIAVVAFVYLVVTAFLFGRTVDSQTLTNVG